MKERNTNITYKKLKAEQEKSIANLKRDAENIKKDIKDTEEQYNTCMRELEGQKADEEGEIKNLKIDLSKAQHEINKLQSDIQKQKYEIEYIQADKDKVLEQKYDEKLKDLEKKLDD
jgi:chromosome segregation ATPase